MLKRQENIINSPQIYTDNSQKKNNNNYEKESDTLINSI